MAFFNIYSESAVQDPTNVGNDLEQIENDVFESRDELTDVSTDSVEEAFNIMYESEYNFNQIMRAIGMAELNEAANGREFFLEGANAKAFFEKIKNGLKKMFESITKAVKKVLHKLDFALKSDKKFISENKSKIEKAAKGKWSYQGYKYTDLLDKAKNVFNTTNLDNITTEMNKLREKADKDDDITDVDIDALNVNIITIIGNREPVLNVDMGKHAHDLALELRNNQTEKRELNKYIDVNKDVIDVLKSDRDTTKIRELYNECKKAFNKAISEIQKYEAKVSKTNDARSTIQIQIAAMANKAYNRSLSVANLEYSCLMKAAREKRAQARAVAHIILRYYEDNKKTLDANATVTKPDDDAATDAKNESTFFDNITFK